MGANPKRSPAKRTPKAALNARVASTLKPGEWASLSAGRGAGVLEARGLAGGGIAYYFRVTARTGQRVRVPIGTGIAFAAAKREAAALSLRYQNGDRDLRAALTAEHREKERQRTAKEAAEQAAKDAEAAKRERTLGALLTAYADQLARDGKPSARSVRAALLHNVRDAWPKLWAAPLADIDADTLLVIVASPSNAGHLRQAEKVRAYLRAAFAAGIKARHNAKALPALRALRVTANPARDLTPIEGANRVRDRALSLDELRAYWQRIRDVPALRFHLLTGCQRIEQLGRVQQADFDADTQSMRLLDSKGRRSAPRAHHVPLLPAAIDTMRTMQSGIAGPYLFTVTAGASGADYSSVSQRVRAVADAMQAAGELPGGRFTPGDLRRTVETRLAAAHISREVRGHLQSHGLGGVQARHYDRHNYLPETRVALETLERLLSDTGAMVVPIRKARNADART